MKKCVVALTLAGMLASTLLCGSALAVSVDMLDKIDITAVKEMEVRSSGKNYYLDLTIMMRNENDRDIMLKDTDFAVKLGSSKYSPRFIGKARENGIEISSVGSASSAGSEVKLAIGLGSNQAKVLDTLTYVMNIVGNPKSDAVVVLDGTAIPSIRAKRGYVDENDRVKISNWEWSPKIQKELLME